MNTPWNIILQCRLGIDGNAQENYHSLYEIALKYRYRNLRNIAVPISNKALTDSIFDLNSHDEMQVHGKKINGQKFKEVFIANIFLKHLEIAVDRGSPTFVVLPIEEGSCDVAVMIEVPNAKLMENRKRQHRLTSSGRQFRFQVKESLDFRLAESRSIATMQPVNTTGLDKLVRGYSELVLVFLRNFFEYSSEQMNDFFGQNPNCFLISYPHDVLLRVGENWKQRELPKYKHNYIITFPDNSTCSIVSFDRPRCLVALKAPV